MDAWLLHRFYILLYTYKLDEFTFFLFFCFFAHLVKTRTQKQETRNIHAVEDVDFVSLAEDDCVFELSYSYHEKQA